MNLLKALPLAAIFAIAPSAWGTTLYYNFDTFAGQLNTSQTYTSNAVTITAYGYDQGRPDDLYGKQNGGDENGLGLMGDSDHEIQSDSFVQLNLSNVWALHPSSVSMSIGSVQSGENWVIYGSNTLGKLGSEIQSGTLDAPSNFLLAANAKNYQFISVEAGSQCADVLLGTLTATTPQGGVPEPGSFALLGAGLIGMGFFVRKVRK